MDSPDARPEPLRNDPAREATGAMRGYDYQIWRSVLAWIGLADGEYLFLEGAEDFDRIGPGDATATQAKDTARSGTVTLRSAGAVQAIGNFWAHRQRNPGRRVLFRYLTTSRVGRERSDPFGRGLPGIELWRRAKDSADAERREKDMEALRAFLIAEERLPEGLRESLDDCSPDEFLNDVVQPIEWETEAADTEEVRRGVLDRLVEYGDRRGVSPSIAKRVASVLFDEAWRVVTQDRNRWLTRARFLEIFEETTTVPVPISALDRLGPPSLFPDGGSPAAPARSAPPPLSPADMEAVERAFGAASRALLDWPSEIDGEWIERPELDRLRELALSGEPSVAALLGGPGSGKSALLARLGARLREDGAILLAIKADRAPREMATLDGLDRWIGCPVPAVEALRRLAEKRRVVVLIDQLDALADLMDTRAGRLSALLALADRIRGTPNLQVIVSCRAFEFEHDVRLNTLEAKRIDLPPPSRERVEPLLAARGYDTSGWSDEAREVLRTPQHLALFLEHADATEGAPVFDTYHGLLERVVERLAKARGESAVEAAGTIAIAMAEEEELELAAARFEARFRAELEVLEADGFLVRSGNGLRIAFRHQTVFDFLRARAFLRTGQSLADYVLEKKQESLFVRPVLWSALTYIRAADPATYRREFGRLWARQGLRPHLRDLLIAFLGQADRPTGEEAGRLLPLLDDPAGRARALQAVAGNAGWFARLQGRLPALMAESGHAGSVVHLLSRAAAFDREAVLSLVEEHWLHDERRHADVFFVMRAFEAWDDRSVAIANALADGKTVGDRAIRLIAEKISESMPDAAPAVIVRRLRAETRKTAGNRQSLENPVDRNTDWHDLDKLAAKAPKVFVEEIWPWLVDVVEKSITPQNKYFDRYREHSGLVFYFDSSDSSYIENAIEAAIRGFAETDADAFIGFVKAEKTTEIEVLHRLLALGLMEIAAERPKAVLEYLLEDSRRFSLGDVFDRHGVSGALIRAVAPALGQADSRRLEDAIVAWSPYRSALPDETAEVRLERLKWSREHRLTLLRYFPFDRLSRDGQRLLREEERAFPNHRENPKQKIGLVEVESPVSADQMKKASNEHILSLFYKMTDNTEWRHPTRDRMEHLGGSIQVSREFAEFAKAEPDRALNIISRFRPGETERPAGMALEALGGSAVPAETLVALVHDLDRRGFASQEFREDAAQCLRAVARRADGLDDSTCDMLQGWIADWRPPEEPSGSRSVGGGNAGGEEKNNASLLWGMGRWAAVPHGNYPILEALTHGFLQRKPPDADRWLDVLKRHLDRPENPEVWNAMGLYFQSLQWADRTMVADFLQTLVDRFPAAFDDQFGVHTVAYIEHWIPDDLLDRILDRWIAGDWADGPQAAGEIAALKLCRAPADPAAKNRVERCMAAAGREHAVAEGLRAGLAYTLAACWDEQTLRELATPLLIRLARHAEGAVAAALGSIFLAKDGPPPDDFTRRLLEALLERPEILRKRAHFVAEASKGWLRAGWNAGLVHSVANALVDGAGSDLASFHTDAALAAPDLADIALTLHRIPETRVDGLELFERLMALRAYDLETRLREIDRPAFPPAPARG